MNKTAADSHIVLYGTCFTHKQLNAYHEIPRPLFNGLYNPVLNIWANVIYSPQDHSFNRGRYRK